MPEPSSKAPEPGRRRERPDGSGRGQPDGDARAKGGRGPLGEGAAGRAAGQEGAAGADRGLPSDHDLIRRAQKGDEDAFRLLVERHQQRAYRVARALVSSREDALDLAQDAFLRVFRSLERFDFEHEFTTWLYRIVTNLGIDHLRKRRVVFSTSVGEGDEADFDLLDENAPRPDAALEQEETAARVRAIIDRLPPHFRSVLALRELEGLPCTEIARIVGATHVTVRWRLHRGRKLFQEEWERQERLRQTGGVKLIPECPISPESGEGADGESDAGDAHSQGTGSDAV